MDTTSEDKEIAKKFLFHTRVDGWTPYHVLGCFERRVTFYSQQVRALNLVWALRTAGVIDEKSKIAVIGGGIGGLTAAAALRHHKHDVTVFEKGQTFLPIQRGTTHRWVHPHIYDWPASGSTVDDAGLPLMNWRAGYVDALIRDLDAAWQTHSQADDDKHLNATINDIFPDGTISWTCTVGGADKLRFDVVIVAVGFGREEYAPLPSCSYWDPENLHRSGMDAVSKAHLISGCGDGGIIDLLRVRILDFRADDIVRKMERADDYSNLQTAILQIEDGARNITDDAKAAEYLYTEYRKLQVPPGITEIIKPNNHTTAWLCYDGPGPYHPRASALNRFLLSIVLRDGKTYTKQIRITPKTVRPSKKEKSYQVDFGGGNIQYFDEVTIRHGPHSALRKLNHKLHEVAEKTLRQRNILDETRTPLWPRNVYFGTEPAPIKKPGQQDASESDPPSKILDRYLDKLRVEVNRVRLPGDSENRGLADTWVELRLTRERVESNSFAEEANVDLDREKKAALDEELESRRKSPRERPPEQTEILDAVGLLSLDKRIVIDGAAGSGKSTLMRYLVLRAIEAYERDPNKNALPIWFRYLPPHRQLAKNPARKLASQALEDLFDDDPLFDDDVGLKKALRDHVERGQAVIMIDGLDEAAREEHARISKWVTQISGGNVIILASRPLGKTNALESFTKVQLHGLPRIAAEAMLNRYFPEAEWIPRLFDQLRDLPEGQRWQETPMLLGLAAMLIRHEDELPRTLTELYHRAIDHLLRDERLQDRGTTLRPGLAAFARSKLLPETGAPSVVFEVRDWNEGQRNDYPKTGLFVGQDKYRFAHLMLGERLAAEATTSEDLERERRKLRETVASDKEGAALEVLPMAHALLGEPELQKLLDDARTNDCSDHRMLRLLLRSIMYGGTGVEALCRNAATDIVGMVIGRLQMPSGRFGNAERALLDAAESAFPVMRQFVRKEDVDPLLAPLVQTHGEIAAETALFPALLGYGKVELKPGEWWATINRQARCLVKEAPAVDGIAGATRGGDTAEQALAVQVLGQTEAYWPEVRWFLYSDSLHLRLYAGKALEKCEMARKDFREMLRDEEPTILGLAAHVLCQKLGVNELDILCLVEAFAQSSGNTREFLVNAGAPRSAFWPLFREVLRDSLVKMGSKENFGRSLRHDLISALATDPDSAPLIEAWLERIAEETWVSAATLRKLASITRWEAPVVGILVSAIAGEVADEIDLRIAAIQVLGERPEHWHRIRKFLHSGVEREGVAAIDALADDEESRDTIRGLLYGEHNLCLASSQALAKHKIEHPRLREYISRTPREEKYHGKRWVVLQSLNNNPDSDTLVLCNNILRDANETLDMRALAAVIMAHEQRYIDDVFTYWMEHREIADAVCKALPKNELVRERLHPWLKPDLGTVRSVAIKYATEYAECRASLRALASSNAVGTVARWTALDALGGDKDDQEVMLQIALKDPGVTIRSRALWLLRHNARLREILRERARSPEWIEELAFMQNEVDEILLNDPYVWPILLEHFDPNNVRTARRLAPLLANYPPAYPKLREMLAHFTAGDSDSDEKRMMRAAAIRGLGYCDEARPQLIEALRTPKHTQERIAAAEALQHDSTLRHDYLPLLSHPKSNIRRLAIRVVASDKSPTTRAVLRERMNIEADGTTRQQLIEALGDDEEQATKNAFREQLREDPAFWVRFLCAHYLTPSTPATALPFAKEAPISRVLAMLPANGAKLAEEPLAKRLQDFIANPRLLDIEENREFAEIVLAWICIRLTWASVTGDLDEGRVYGEVENPIESLIEPNQKVLVRVAMDSGSLPREREMRPSNNVLEAWGIARYLVAKNPPSILLVCADVDFEHIPPLELNPGAVSWGPTYFGFRIHTRESAVKSIWSKHILS